MQRVREREKGVEMGGRSQNMNEGVSGGGGGGERRNGGWNGMITNDD